MIIIGQAVLTASLIDPDLNPDNPRIGYDNVITEAALSADSEDADYPVVNVLSPNTFQKWVSESVGEQYLTIDIGNDTEADYFALAGHNFGSAGVTYQLQGTNNLGLSSPPTWDNLSDERTPSNNDPILYHFGSEVYKAYRLRLVPNASTPPRLAVFYLGKILVFQRRVYVGFPPPNLNRDITVSSGYSETGEFLGRIELRRALSSSFQLQNLTASWYRVHFDPFAEACGSTVPFFFAWRPGSYPDEIVFAWLRGSPRPTNQRSNGMMQVALDLQAQAQT